MEWTESKISVRAKSASGEEQREEEATKLKNKIDSLTAILKSSTLGISKPEGNEKKEQEKTIQKGGQRVNPPQLLQWKVKDQDSSDRSIKR